MLVVPSLSLYIRVTEYTVSYTLWMEGHINWIKELGIAYKRRLLPSCLSSWSSYVRSLLEKS